MFGVDKCIYLAFASTLGATLTTLNKVVLQINNNNNMQNIEKAYEELKQAVASLEDPITLYTGNTERISHKGYREVRQICQRVKVEAQAIRNAILTNLKSRSKK